MRLRSCIVIPTEPAAAGERRDLLLIVPAFRTAKSFLAEGVATDCCTEREISLRKAGLGRRRVRLHCVEEDEEPQRHQEHR
jgi:hypothetical protein